MKPLPFSESELEFIKSNYKNSTPKDILLALNRVRIASKRKILKYSTVKDYISRNLSEASSEKTPRKVSVRGKGRPSKKSTTQAVENLYGECSQMDDLSPDFSILDEGYASEAAKLLEGNTPKPLAGDSTKIEK